MASLLSAARPLTLASAYEKLINHGDYQSHCRALAIEFELRNRAIILFHVSEVLEALNRLETALKSRKRKHNKILAAGPEVES